MHATCQVEFSWDESSSLDLNSSYDDAQGETRQHEAVFACVVSSVYGAEAAYAGDQ